MTRDEALLKLLIALQDIASEEPANTVDGEQYEFNKACCFDKCRELAKKVVDEVETALDLKINPQW